MKISLLSLFLLVSLAGSAEAVGLPIGDLSGDCIVNLNDVLLFTGQWLDNAGCSGLGCADLDGDNNVDSIDFALLAAHWYERGKPLVINEFMASNTSTPAEPNGGFPDWIEIYNVSSQQVNLKDWYLTDDAYDLNKWEFPAMQLQAGAYLLVFATDKNLRDPCSPLHTNFKLSAGGEYLALVQPDGNTAHEYAPKYPQQCTDISYGLTVELNVPVFFTSPTPGAENGLGAEELGPIITDAQHSPLVPHDGNDIVVTAKITDTLDPVDTSSVKLHYRVMFGSEPNVSMVDDGTGPDANSGDGIYTALIPNTASAPGQMVRWYIAADDTNNVSSRWPLFPYPDNSPEYLGTMIANPSVTSALPILHWYVANTSAADTDTGTRASLFFNGNFYDNLFCRTRGRSIANYPKKSYKFDFNRGFHFYFSPYEDSVEEFNLNATYTDKAYVRQTLAFETYRDAGTHSSISFPMRIQRNDAFFSVAIFIEQPDDDFLERRGLDPEGALYKVYNRMDGVSPSATVKKTRRDGDYSDIQALVDGLALSGEDKRRFLYDNINIPSFVSFMAAAVLGNDADQGKKNYYAYRDTNGSREWLYLPWDKDLTFGKNWSSQKGSLDDLLYYYYRWDGFSGPSDPDHPLYTYSNNRLFIAMHEFADTKEMYLRRLRTVMDELLQSPSTPYAQKKYEQHIDELVTQMAPDVALDYNLWCNPWDYGEDQNFAQAIYYLKTDFLDPSRTLLFVTHNVGSGGMIPDAQPASPALDINSTVEFNPSSGNQDEEYIRLDNPNAYAVDISGYRLTGGVEHTFQPGVVIPTGGGVYVSPNVRAFRARATSPKGGEGLFVQGNYNGHLSSWGEVINLLDTDANLVDTITYPGNPSNQQRYLRITEMMYHPADPNLGSPYNDEDFEYIELKNIGPNTLDLDGVKFTDGIIYDFPSSSPTITDVNLIGPADSWKYEESFTDLGTAWRAADYNDSSWPSGAAVLYDKNGSFSPPAPWLGNTQLTTQNGKITFYFRKHFTLAVDPAVSTVNLTMTTLIDDGAVFYINGTEVKRLGMPGGAISYSTLADRSVSNPVTEGPFTIGSGSLVAGDNVLAVEVHQESSNSSDIALGLMLDANIITPGVPSISLDPNKYVLLVKDPNAFADRYPSAPPDVNILGPYDGQLSNGGETVKLEDSTNSTILEFDYKDGWYPITDGSGFPLVIIDANDPNLDSWDNKDGWRPGAILGGSPGEDNQAPVQNPGDIVINEVMAHSHGGAPDWIELYNTTDANINISGWFLSDNDDDFMKYEIAAGTMIDANDYIVFYEDTDFNDPGDPGCYTPFALSENGEEVYLSSGLSGQLAGGYSEKEDFGASETGVSFGRYIKSTGDVDFVAMDYNTPGNANAYPKIGPVVINEIMYNPQSGNQNEEYIELYNITASL
ncbi:MAG: lamin tail domain-containing protein, partial [Planctomycetota bacterium]